MTNGSLAANRPLTQRSAWTRAVGAVAVLFVVNLVALELLMLISTLAHWSGDVHTRAEVGIGSAIIGEVVFLVLLIWWLHREHLALRDLGLRKRPKAWAVLVAVAFAVAYGLLSASNPGLRSNLGLHDFLKAEAVVAAVVAGIVEEVGSDADLVFIIPDGDATEHTFWTGVAERIRLNPMQGRRETTHTAPRFFSRLFRFPSPSGREETIQRFSAAYSSSF